MSVSHKKINSLISTIINNSDKIKITNGKKEVNKDLLINLCHKIYLIESSTSSISQNQMIDDIKNEIDWYSSKITSE